MNILFDHSTPAPLARFLPRHSVTKAKERGWDTLTNRELLAAGEGAGFDLLLTADQNMRYQQNFTGRRIALVVLGTPQWPRVQLQIEKILATLNAATPGSYAEIEIPLSVAAQFSCRNVHWGSAPDDASVVAYACSRLTKV